MTLKNTNLFVNLLILKYFFLSEDLQEQFLYVYIYIYIYTCICVYIYFYILVCVYIYMYMYNSIYAHIYVYIYIYYHHHHVPLHAQISLILTIYVYHPLLLIGLLDYILCPYRSMVDKFLLVGQYLHVSKKVVLFILFGWF